MPLIFCDFTVALFAAAPMRKPHGVAQICICWTHAGVAAVIICSYVPIGGSGPPRTAAGGCVIPVACDAGALKSIVRT